MEAHISERPDRRTVDIYLGTSDAAFVYGGSEPGDREVQLAKTGEERRPFLRLTDQELAAIERAIVARREGVLAERQTLREGLDDARRVRDRLLALVEELAE